MRIRTPKLTWAYFVSSIAFLSFIFTGCQSGSSGLAFDNSSDVDGGSPTNVKSLSEMKTFAVQQPGGDTTAFTWGANPNIETITVGSITAQLEAKGYKPASLQSADFVIKPIWLTSMTDNPLNQINQGTVDTAQQVASQVEVATLKLIARDRVSDKQLWAGNSSWPFDVRRASIANVQNAVSWALSKFPMAMVATQPTVTASKTSSDASTVK